jgi:hypothetical protein
MQKPNLCNHESCK